MRVLFIALAISISYNIWAKMDYRGRFFDPYGFYDYPYPGWMNPYHLMPAPRVPVVPAAPLAPWDNTPPPIGRWDTNPVFEQDALARPDVVRLVSLCWCCSLSFSCTFILSMYQLLRHGLPASPFSFVYLRNCYVANTPFSLASCSPIHFLVYGRV